MLRITPEVHDEMFAHALAALPNEACGMFSTPPGDDVVDEFHPMQNAAASPQIFRLDGQEMLDVEREVEGRRRSLVGVMHSHTETSPYPSPTDVEDIARFDPFGAFHHAIVSLRHAEPELRSYRIIGETITEEPVIVDDGASPDDEQAQAVAVIRPLP